MHRCHSFYVASRLRAFQIYDENAVRTRGFVVFGCFAYHSVGVSNEKVVEGVFLSVAVKTLQVIQLQLSIGAFPGLHFWQVLQLLRHIFYCQQVVADRLVNLQVADVNPDVL